MKARHAAALALVGWYLIQPPGMDATVPLNQWPIHHRFDSIAECEARIHKLDDAVRSSAYQARLGSLGLSPELEHGSFAVRNSKCISTDDPRLKPNSDTQAQIKTAPERAQP
jgi:hypothetical protein